MNKELFMQKINLICGKRIAKVIDKVLISDKVYDVGVSVVDDGEVSREWLYLQYLEMYKDGIIDEIMIDRHEKNSTEYYMYKQLKKSTYDEKDLGSCIIKFCILRIVVTLLYRHYEVNELGRRLYILGRNSMRNREKIAEAMFQCLAEITTYLDHVILNIELLESNDMQLGKFVLCESRKKSGLRYNGCFNRLAFELYSCVGNNLNNNKIKIIPRLGKSREVDLKKKSLGNMYFYHQNTTMVLRLPIEDNVKATCSYVIL